MKINIEKVWGKSRPDRWGVVVHIENRGQVFKFMPTYDHVKKIVDLLKEVEVLNKDLNIKKEVGQVPEELNGI